MKRGLESSPFLTVVTPSIDPAQGRVEGDEVLARLAAANVYN